MIDLVIYTEKLKTLSKGKQINLMEVCGTHTMSIAKYGIKRLMPENIKLLSGPGCPVCVTQEDDIDMILSLTEKENVIITSYGDMMRVPGSKRGDSLFKRKALGAKAEVVYSPMDAVFMAKENPDKEVVFIGVGFETTAPGTAAAVKFAYEEGVKNFSVLSLLKAVEPSLRALIEGEGFKVDGFICPGHVASIVGEKGFEFLEKDYHIPSVITGFEAEDILLSILKLVGQIAGGVGKVENEYTRAAKVLGNTLAEEMIEEVLERDNASWRGLGNIDKSGYVFKGKYEAYDAVKKLGLTRKETKPEINCRCADVICGRIDPMQCKLFKCVCTPEDPCGPCMVSTEGACAAAYKYGDLL